MAKRINYTGQRFGNRLILRDLCEEEDWIKINKPIPSDTSKYSLGKCLNCGAILPTLRRNLLEQPPKRCVYCSNIGNHHNIKTETNSWVVRGDIAICNIIYHNKIISFTIDSDRYDEVSKLVWRISKKKNKYYVVSGSIKKKSMVYIHQLIFGEKKDGFEIDHIDGNSLNNRKSNLRLVTHLQNIDNIRATRIDNKIGIRGIAYDKRDKKYTVDFHYHNSRFYFKPWETVEEAVYCRGFLEKQFGLSMLENNPLAKNYQLTDKRKMEEIEEYVLKKIS